MNKHHELESEGLTIFFSLLYVMIFFFVCAYLNYLDDIYSFPEFVNLFSLLGITFFLIFMIWFIYEVYYPKSDEELRLEDKIEKLDKSIKDSRLRRLKERELRTEFELKRIKDKLSIYKI